MVKKWIEAIFSKRKLRQILKGVRNVVLGDNLSLSRDRKKICKQCLWRQKICGTFFCKVCGCSIKLKTSVKDEKCPMDKW